ncbi:MAG TPA: ABC transporter permease [Gammaproteobacteria bacterium]|nr:ABC transporter permease [Gammaproteobacteria bacterium]
MNDGKALAAETAPASVGDQVRWRVRDTLGIYGREAAYQFWGLVRMPGFALPTLLFPAMFYLFFGALFGGRQYGAYFLATYATFGVMGPALFGFGVGVAMEREHGVLSLKRVFPLPPLAYFCAKLAMSALFALIITVILSILAAATTGVVLPRANWFVLAGVLVAGTLPFCALGLTIGFYVNGQASAAIVNLIYLPMSFLSGLWVPIQQLPDFLQHFARALPAYHLGQLALAVVGRADGDSIWTHIGYLIVFTIVFLLIALRGWRRIQDR